MIHMHFVHISKFWFYLSGRSEFVAIYTVVPKIALVMQVLLFAAGLVFFGLGPLVWKADRVRISMMSSKTLRKKDGCTLYGNSIFLSTN